MGDTSAILRQRDEASRVREREAFARDLRMVVAALGRRLNTLRDK